MDTNKIFTCQHLWLLCYMPGYGKTACRQLRSFVIKPVLIHRNKGARGHDKGMKDEEPFTDKAKEFILHPANALAVQYF